MKRLALVMSVIVVLAAIVCFSTSALAVEDGLGTNIVKNLRVQNNGTLITGTNSDLVIGTDGSITLDNQQIFQWDDLATDISWNSAQLGTVLSNKVAGLETSTNALNTAVTNEIVLRGDADTGISNAFHVADTGISNAFHLADTGVSNSLQTASNELYGTVMDVSNALDIAKYEKTGGPISGDVTIGGYVTISGDVIMSNKVVYSPGAEAVIAATPIGCGQAVKIINAAADRVMNVDPPIATPVPPAAGQMLTLICDKTFANSIMFTNTDGLKLSGGVSFTMKSNDVIQCVFDGLKWIEVHRADNQ